jgi:hypothetical protein
MNDFEKKKIEMELKSFTSAHFERPSSCRNLEQIRFYVNELCKVIETYEKRFNYVPGDAYTLLAQYNARQNSLLYKDFVNSY